jgi:putative membrane protein
VLRHAGGDERMRELQQNRPRPGEQRDPLAGDGPRNSAWRRASDCNTIAPMAAITSVLIGLVAALHLYFLTLEMFLWDTPYGRRVFGSTPEFSKASKTLASNQGLYNGFLAAGLIWSLLDPHSHAFELKVFFLTCVVVAGIYGGLTASRKILFVQALPGAVALVAVHVR